MIEIKHILIIIIIIIQENSGYLKVFNFFTGNGHDYMNLALKDGGVSLTVQLGTGKLDTAIKPGTVRFDDNAWHHVLVVRKSSEVHFQLSLCYFLSFLL